MISKAVANKYMIIFSAGVIAGAIFKQLMIVAGVLMFVGLVAYSWMSYKPARKSR